MLQMNFSLGRAGPRNKDGNRKQLCDRRHHLARRGRHKALLLRLKDVPCKDCTERFPPYVMQFDHCRGVKLKEISRMDSASTGKVMAEVAKCDVVCANCHAIRTHQRTQK